MTDLSTKYMGLKLKNPVIVASSGLTSTVDKVTACEKAGAGAVVLKSLFEEQIMEDTKEIIDQADIFMHPEARNLLSNMGESFSTEEYFNLVRQAKEKTGIPIIASVNCITSGAWIDYTKSFEEAGADALELNFFIMPAGINQDPNAIETLYMDICRKIKSVVSIPVSMKIGPYFTALANMSKRLSDEGMDGLVLFNRFYRPDFDIQKLKLKAANINSSKEEMFQTLQWVALLSDIVKADLSASTGIHDADGVIKQLLAGAKTVQMCTALYKKGLDSIKVVITGLMQWMEKHNFSCIDDFCGKLSVSESQHPEIFERCQYIKAIVGIS